MLNTHKLLYILPDVAYIAELLPTKKEHTFAIHSFRQINGDFLNDEDDLIAENIEKLFSKIEPETYHLVLPDFLFTNTILEIKETQESKVRQYIKDELLPSLNLSKDTHEIETFILTQYNNVSKIQLTALEKEVMAPVATSAAKHKVEIENISPLSWTIKSVISLEPSISVVQIGSVLYVAEHYIGVDQCTMAKVEEIENVGETIKTLKGSQPSIQTIYLLTNTLVEEKLKDLVSSTLPIQQLTAFKEEDNQMPSYVKQIIESGMKTLDISDYPVPSFALPKVDVKPDSSAKSAEAPVTKPKALEVFEDDETEIDEVTPAQEVKISTTETEIEVTETLPVPMPIPDIDAEAEAKAEADKPDEETSSEDELPTEEPSSRPSFKAVIEEAEEAADEELEEIKADLELPDTSVETAIAASSLAVNPKAPSTDGSLVTTDKPTTTVSEVQPQPPVRPVIKNRGGNGAWVKMLLIMITVFAVTVAVGIGIGLIVLNVTGQTGEVVSPSPSPSPTAAPSPSPSPSPSPIAIERGELSILVVNATTKAGYAGSTRTKLEDAGYQTVRAANAKGEYEPGLYVLMKTDNPALVSALQTDSGLDLTFADGYQTEDPKEEYDAVVVLAE